MYASASRSTCWRCASRLCSAQAKGPGGAALFSSLSNEAPARSRESSSYNNHHRNWSGNGRGGGYTGKRQGQYPKSASKDRAIALFENVVNRTPAAASSLPLGDLEIMAKIAELVKRELAPVQKMEAFIAEIRPHLAHQTHGLPANVTASLNRFVDHVCESMVQGGIVEGHLLLSQIASGFGNFDLSWRNHLVLNLCGTLLRLDRESSNGESSNGESSDGERTTKTMSELINLWKHISLMKRLMTRDREALRFTLATPEEVLRDIRTTYKADGPQGTRMSPTMKALTSIFLQFAPQETRRIISGLLVTVAMVSDARFSTEKIQKEAAPLLHLVATVLEGDTCTCTVTEPFFLEALSSDHLRFSESQLQELGSYAAKQWPAVTAMLNDGEAAWRKQVSTTRGPQGARTIQQFQSQLRRASTLKMPQVITALWDELKASAREKPAFADELRRNADFFNEWVEVLCATRQGHRVPDVLDVMKQLNVRPDVTTYTSMMHGWKTSKETQKIEALWDRLVKSSSVRLDAHIWTERISGLIGGGKPQAGIQALAEMQALWKAAVEMGSPETAVQPTIAVVNAAFKGLITLDRRAALDVLDWAGREQIMPDVRTYNILLQQTFRNDPPGEPGDVQAIFRAMEGQGIEPDQSTFTILLQEVLGGIASQAAEDQVRAVQSAFAHVEAAGFRPNERIYAKMIYAVTDFANGGSDETINAVLAHMRRNHRKVTPEIATILVERAVRVNPQNIAAIRKILDDHGFSRIELGDQTLWERVMSAHAVAKDAAGALAIFHDLAGLKRPATSLQALNTLLHLLLEQGQMEDAKTVVDMVLRHKLANIEGPNDARYWQHHFWYMASEYGLFVWKDLPSRVRMWVEDKRG